MFTIDNLTISYGNNTVLNSLTLSMNNGNVYGIVGYNGSGKTTLLNAIFGIPKQYDCISFNGAPLSRYDVAYSDTDIFFYPRITGRDYLQVFEKKNLSFDFESACSIFNVL